MMDREYPPFCAGPSDSRTDWTASQRAAERLAAMIADAWLHVGYRVTPVVEDEIRRSQGNITWVVRLPELVNGCAPPHLRVSSRY